MPRPCAMTAEAMQWSHKRRVVITGGSFYPNLPSSGWYGGLAASSSERYTLCLICRSQRPPQCKQL